MKLQVNDIFLRPLRGSDINSRYIYWFAYRQYKDWPN